MEKFNHFGDVLSYRAQITPNNIAVEFLSNDKKLHSVTYKDLHEQAQSAAHQLLALAKPNERVLLIYPPSLEFLYAFLGCLYAGVIAVPLPVPIKGTNLDERLALVIKSANPVLILTSHNITRLIAINSFLNRHAHYSLIKKIQNKLQDITPLNYRSLSLGVPVKSLIKNYLKKMSLGYMPERNDVAFLQYTSGSTSIPRGVMITQSNLMENLEAMRIQSNALESSRMLSWLPQFHDMGLVLALLMPIYSGYKVRFFSPELFIKDPLFWLQQIDAFKATASGGPTFAFSMVLKSLSMLKHPLKLDLSSWTQVFSGADIIDVDVFLTFYEQLSKYGLKSNTFSPCYGLAESVVGVVGIADIDISDYILINKDFMLTKKVTILDKEDKNAIKIVPCGKNYPGQLLFIVEEDGAILPELTIGKIVINSPSVAPGYWNSDDDSEKIFHFNVKGYKEAFLDTGDLGFWYKDYLYIVGRVKEIIKIHGESYFPVWLENSIKNDVSNLKYDTVLALQWIDGLHETLTILIIVKNEKESYELLSKEIFSSILKSYRVRVSQIFFIKKGLFNKTSSGKWPRRLIASALQQKEIPTLYHWKDNLFKLELFDKKEFFLMRKAQEKEDFIFMYLKNITRSITQEVEDVTQKNNIRDVFVDSMAIYQFFIELQRAFDFDMDWDSIIYNEQLTYQQLAKILVIHANKGHNN